MAGYARICNYRTGTGTHGANRSIYRVVQRQSVNNINRRSFLRAPRLPVIFTPCIRPAPEIRTFIPFRSSNSFSDFSNKSRLGNSNDRWRPRVNYKKKSRFRFRRTLYVHTKCVVITRPISASIANDMSRIRGFREVVKMNIDGARVFKLKTTRTSHYYYR